MLPNLRTLLLALVVATPTFLTLQSCKGPSDAAKKGDTAQPVEKPAEKPKDAPKAGETPKDAPKPAEAVKEAPKTDAPKPAETPKETPQQAPKADAPKLSDATDVLAPAGTPKPAEKKQTMDEAITALMAKPEQPDEAITVQHVLIGFKGAPRLNVQRSKDEAKALAEKLWAEAIGGADFKTLMKQSDDTGPGEYPMTKAGRRQMVAAFGDVGFRLKVGEIGVAPQDQQKSPYGWHIIKRVK